MNDRVFTILVTGSREAQAVQDHVGRITDELMKVAEGKGYPVTLIHGGARGVDHIAGIVAKGLGWHVVVHEADWKRYGKAAGHKRNGEMLRVGKPDVVMAFPLQGADNRGTSNCIGQANDYKVSVVKTVLPSVKGAVQK